jgi:hypothetical protein
LIIRIIEIGDLVKEGANKMPSIRDFFTNMSVPMPWHRKLYLLSRNLAIRVLKRRDCCGHDGEPGC